MACSICGRNYDDRDPCLLCREVKAEEKQLEELREKICKKAIAKWGKEKQLDMVIEECSELIKCVVKYRRYDRNKVWELKMIDEMVDVYIMLTQLRLMLMNDKDFLEQMQAKLKRLDAIIDGTDSPYRGLKGEDVGRVIGKSYAVDKIACPDCGLPAAVHDGSGFCPAGTEEAGGKR